ncbi:MULTISPECIES: hypothetical protein [unclassified Microbacterium]|uniref:hypothetical protein n=1 Tax=unclassified Microbacterium TaxID=2609290 RepID=UPI00044D32F9|nr:MULTISPECIES: hypothetical protein [unclassified Microbacterium]EXJ50649.1 hypothetical protein AS96_13715 [Microbacterium sp. MRS-1]
MERSPHGPSDRLPGRGEVGDAAARHLSGLRGPEGAADAILAVVADASATVSTSELESAILARLTAPTGPYEQLAPLEVVRTADGAIGASMGTERRCVLVRRVDGTERVYAPRVYLQPGELGCRGTTARSDLRPPH